MVPEFSAEHVAREVLAHLDARRYAIRGDVALARREIDRALVPFRSAYDEECLPASYMSALTEELCDVLPERFCAAAQRITDLEQRDFGVWRSGDPIARMTYVFFGLIGAGMVGASPLPIWIKWLGFMLAFVSWWVPSWQVAWHLAAYRYSIDRLAADIGAAQPRLERAATVGELLERRRTPELA